MRRILSALFVSSFALAGCTGLSLGENKPGADTWLEAGAIAVDDRTETSFVLGIDSQNVSQGPNKTLYAINPDTASVKAFQDLTGRNDIRILFPEPGVLIMSELAGKDRLDLLDNKTFSLKKSQDADVRYHGTRLSPSRKYVAVADNTSLKAPIHLIESATLATHVVPHNGEWLEAMWMNGTDELLSIVFYDMTSMTPKARILSWAMADVLAANYTPDATGILPSAKRDIELPGVTGDLAFSFTWVGISPDDHWAVFPVRKLEMDQSYSYALIVLDTTTNEVREVPNAKGPVGFTPDSSTIVSYGQDDQNGNQQLLLIDVATLMVDPEPVPIEGGISYFVSRDGNFVVVASSTGGQKLVLYDLAQDKSTQMDGTGVGLFEFVSRPGHGEMWLVDQQSLFKLDLFNATFETIPTSFKPAHINILPMRDRLVLDDTQSSQIHFFDPGSLTTKLTANLGGK